MQSSMRVLQYHVIGMMSGTSLDGTDLSLATYYKKNGKWMFQILACNTFAYDNDQVLLLRSIQNQKLTYLEFRQKELEYSKIIVNAIKYFLQSNKQKIKNIKIDAIGLHGHTIYHNPSESITVQIANLQYIAAKLGLNVIGNFRQLDIHRGGQGAPLAPFGQELFGQHIYLNLGGIANLGYNGKGYDIVFCNMVLNKYSEKIQNKPFDQNGVIGSQGQIDKQQLQKIRKKFNNVDKHSLARQQVRQFLNQIQISQLPTWKLKDKMRTFYEFISQKIIQSIVSLKEQLVDKKLNKIEVYCTGGGAFNKFLIDNLNKNSHNISFILPNSDIINFKQALIFGLLAVKFLQGEQNCENGTGGQLIKGQVLCIK